MTAFGAKMMVLVSAVFLLPVAFRQATATEFIVGAEHGWVVPNDTNALDYQSWANTNNFVVGDILIFNTNPFLHSVLSVTGPAFAACDTSEPLQELVEYNTTITLEQEGRMWFICGTANHCSKGQAFTITVSAAQPSASAPVPESVPGNAPIKASKAVVILVSIIMGICHQVL